MDEVKPNNEKVNKNGFFNSEYPLGLPQGSVRAIIAIITILGIIHCTINEIVVPNYMIAITANIIAFFFLGHTPIGSKSTAINK